MIFLPKGDDAIRDAIERSLFTQKKIKNRAGSWFEFFEDRGEKINNIAGIGTTLETKGKYLNPNFLTEIKKKSEEALAWLVSGNILEKITVDVYQFNSLVYIDITSGTFKQQLIV